MAAASSSGDPYSRHAVTAHSVGDAGVNGPEFLSLPPGWKRYFDHACDEFYYHHRDTGVTQWTRPGGSLPPGRKQCYETETGCAEWTRPHSPPKLHLRMAVSGKEFSVNCLEGWQVVHLQRIIAGHCIPAGWEQVRLDATRDSNRVFYYHKDTDCLQADHPLGDVIYRLLDKGRVLLPSDFVCMNSAAKPYMVVTIQVPTLRKGSKHIAAVAYTAERGGYLSVAPGDEVEILKGPEPGAHSDHHFKYYYGRVRDNEGWFAWDIFV